MRSMLLAGITVALVSSGFAQTDSVKAEATDTNVIAVVLDKKITANEKDNLNGLIFGALLQRYAKENQIEPTDEELDAFVRRTEEKEKQHQAKFERDRERLRKELKSASLSGRDRKEKESQLKTIESILKSTREMKKQTKGTEEMMRPIKRQTAQQFVKSWKINKALHEKYGGRVIFQQAGVEPLDAYRDFLKEQEKKGAFQILDKQYEPGFWRYFTNDAMHTFYKKKDGANFINTPWWMMEEPTGE
ncbi:MAG: SurA N-terminal domain-containing protein [Nitrospira sp.]|nr:SurA N-terminal domain-containing protein [Nitrospira sp.]